MPIAHVSFRTDELTRGAKVFYAAIAASEDQIRTPHATALPNSGLCEGLPGLRVAAFYPGCVRYSGSDTLNTFHLPSAS